MSVDVILGDHALSLAAWQGGVLHLFRTRLRESGPREPQWLATRGGPDGGAGRQRRPLRGSAPSGPGAMELLRAWSDEGRAGEPGWRAEGALPVEAAELAWLGAALA